MATETKKALRKSMNSRLSALSEEDISHQSLKAQQRILDLPQYRNAGRISVYLSMPKAEAQTNLIVHDALDAGKKVFVPYIHRPKAADGEPKKRSIIEMLRLESGQEYEGLARDSWGIPSLPLDGLERRENAMGGSGLEDASPDESRREDVLDLVVVPGVAFDPDMNRLGHGAGFYDEYLMRCSSARSGTRPFLVGLCLAEQYLEGAEETSVPTSEHDWRMNAVALGDGRLVSSKRS